MLHKEKYYRERIWPKWLQEFRHASRSALLLHGIMGSELYDKREQDTVWVDMGIWHEVDNLELKKLTPKGAIDTDSQFLYARSTVHPPVVSDPYSEILEQLNPGRFNYDWRDSIPIEAQRLAQFLDVLFNEHNEPIQFVTHSMGGCVLLWLLSQTDRFDDRISRIIFVAPPFHGALKPIRVIEEGTGTPADWLIRNSVLRRSAATFPGLFQLLVAQKGAWPTELPRPASTPIRLKHPIRAAASLYDPGAWTNRYRMRLRGKILEFAKRFHHRIWNQASRIVQRQGLAGKITVLVGLNGKTAYSATRHDREWQIHRLENPPDGKVSNGDGTVLFQSSFLPGLSTDAYWAYVPRRRRNVHGSIMDEKPVIDALRTLLSGDDLSATDNIVPYSDFIDRIDWRREAQEAVDPARNTELDYLERASARATTPRRRWGRALNPDGNDALLFGMTRAAALRIILGESDCATECELTGQPENFLLEHMQTLLMPVLYG